MISFISGVGVKFGINIDSVIENGGGSKVDSTAAKNAI
jgi:hypothetical protein